MSNIIEIQNLTKSYKKFPVFLNLNISINEQSSTIILGLNGCGNTRLLKTINGTTKVNEGNISIFNTEILKNDPNFGS